MHGSVLQLTGGKCLQSTPSKARVGSMTKHVLPVVFEALRHVGSTCVQHDKACACGCIQGPEARWQHVLAA
eukprot:1156886-Pelagomonas_calceolata.AAC.1